MHQWGDWSFRELYVNAKAATLHPRRGIWRCSGISASTATGAAFFKCPELAIHMIRAGMAHADRHAEPSPEACSGRSTRRDKEPARHVGRRRPQIRPHLTPSGGWRRTRLGLQPPGLDPTMNSGLWIHGETYGECDKVCVREVELDSQVLREAKQRLDSVDELTTWRSLPARKQVEVLEIWLMIETVSAHIPKAERDPDAPIVDPTGGDRLARRRRLQGGCMIYVTDGGSAAARRVA